MDKDDLIAGQIFDAAAANWIVLGELIVALVEGGSLSRDAAVTILVRSERVIARGSPHSPAVPAHELLLEHVVARLALQPEIAARRRDRRR